MCLPKRYFAMPDLGALHLAQVGNMITQFFDGFHPLIQIVSLNEVMFLSFFCLGPVYTFPILMDSHIFPSVTHIPLHSAYSPLHRGLVPRYPEGRTTLLVLQLHPFFSMFPLIMRLLEKILGKLLQSHIVMVKVVKTWTGRCGRWRAPGWYGGSSDTPMRRTQLLRQVAKERQLCSAGGGLGAIWGLWGSDRGLDVSG